VRALLASASPVPITLGGPDGGGGNGGGNGPDGGDPEAVGLALFTLFCSQNTT
jgi:hypothetical protein